MRTLPPDPPTTAARDKSLDRRHFLKAAGAGAGLLALGTGESAKINGVASPVARRTVPSLDRSGPNIVVVGAGLWGSFTAYNLRKKGAIVTMVDEYGPGNSRSTSGDETRGVRSSYGNEPEPKRELWMQWAREAMIRWPEFDAEWSRDLRTSLFHTTGDLLMRTDWDAITINTKAMWDKHLVHYEQLNPEEARRRWPVIQMDDIKVVLYEPDAGVIRARRAAQTAAAAFQHLGGKIVVGRAHISKHTTDGRVEEIALDSGEVLRADLFVFCLGPWLGKVFPEMATRMRTPLGKVCYFGTPAGDNRFTYPNLPSYNFPGVTGWPALPVDNIGFRVRGGARAQTPATPADSARADSLARVGGGRAGADSGRAAGVGPGRGGRGAGGGGRGGRGGPPDTTVAGGRAGRGSPADVALAGRGQGRGSGTPGQGGTGRGGGAGGAPAADPALTDPDLSSRWLSETDIQGPRNFVTQRFPLLKDAPLLKTHSCHYELTSSGNFIIDLHPRMPNVWIAAGGNSEGAKFAPVLGAYVAQRVLGTLGDPEIAKGFRIPQYGYGESPADSARADSVTRARARAASDSGRGGTGTDSGRAAGGRGGRTGGNGRGGVG